MEDIYTIKVRTNPDPRDLYPSERRYSASTVLGLSVVHLSLAATALLLASLSLPLDNATIKELNNNLEVPNQYENFTDFTNTNRNNGSLTDLTSSRHDNGNDNTGDMAFLDEDVGNSNDLNEDTVIIQNNGYNFEDFYNNVFSLTLSPCFMALGALAAGFAGLLAWKRWYIDQNIKWFFVMSSVSILTSFACLLVTGLTLGVQNKTARNSDDLNGPNAFIFSFSDHNIFVDRLPENATQTNSPNIKTVLAVNLLIATVLEFVWSLLSARISWKGMRNNYPDDIVLARGKIQVNTVQKGNKKCKNMAPDILNHHPTKRKFAKYFPKKEVDYLPKQESNIEYQERVNKFLAANLQDSNYY